MATVQPAAAPRASTLPPNRKPAENDDPLGLSEFDEELKRLSAANQELLAEFKQEVADPSDAAITEAATLPPAIAEEMEFLRLENTELRARIDQLEAMGGGKAEKLWQERQREYEMLLEEKSEVIRSLHQKIQEINESAIGGPPAPSPSMSGSRLGQAPGASSVRLGQAEEILRLKRELDEQRKQLEQDEDDMMAQMKQMEITMAKERAEMARQRQEVQRLQADLAHEIEQSGRAPELRERLNNLRRTQEVKPAAAAAPPLPAAKPKSDQQKSSGFFRRLFG